MAGAHGGNHAAVAAAAAAAPAGSEWSDGDWVERALGGAMPKERRLSDEVDKRDPLRVQGDWEEVERQRAIAEARRLERQRRREEQRAAGNGTGAAAAGGGSALGVDITIYPNDPPGGMFMRNAEAGRRRILRMEEDRQRQHIAAWMREASPVHKKPYNARVIPVAGHPLAPILNPPRADATTPAAAAAATPVLSPLTPAADAAGGIAEAQARPTTREIEVQTVVLSRHALADGRPRAAGGDVRGPQATTAMPPTTVTHGDPAATRVSKEAGEPSHSPHGRASTESTGAREESGGTTNDRAEDAPAAGESMVPAATTAAPAAAAGEDAKANDNITNLEVSEEEEGEGEGQQAAGADGTGGDGDSGAAAAAVDGDDDELCDNPSSASTAGEGDGDKPIPELDTNAPTLPPPPPPPQPVAVEAGSPQPQPPAPQHPQQPSPPPPASGSVPVAAAAVKDAGADTDPLQATETPLGGGITEVSPLIYERPMAYTRHMEGYKRPFKARHRAMLEFKDQSAGDWEKGLMLRRERRAFEAKEANERVKVVLNAKYDYDDIMQKHHRVVDVERRAKEVKVMIEKKHAKLITRRMLVDGQVSRRDARVRRECEEAEMRDRNTIDAEEVLESTRLSLRVLFLNGVAEENGGVDTPIAAERDARIARVAVVECEVEDWSTLLQLAAVDHQTAAHRQAARERVLNYHLVDLMDQERDEREIIHIVQDRARADPYDTEGVSIASRFRKRFNEIIDALLWRVVLEDTHGRYALEDAEATARKAIVNNTPAGRARTADLTRVYSGYGPLELLVVHSEPGWRRNHVNDWWEELAVIAGAFGESAEWRGVVSGEAAERARIESDCLGLYDDLAKLAARGLRAVEDDLMNPDADFTAHAAGFMDVLAQPYTTGVDRARLETAMQAVVAEWCGDGDNATDNGDAAAAAEEAVEEEEEKEDEKEGEDPQAAALAAAAPDGVSSTDPNVAQWLAYTVSVKAATTAAAANAAGRDAADDIDPWAGLNDL